MDEGIGEVRGKLSSLAIWHAHFVGEDLGIVRTLHTVQWRASWQRVPC